MTEPRPRPGPWEVSGRCGTIVRDANGVAIAGCVDPQTTEKIVKLFNDQWKEEK